MEENPIKLIRLLKGAPISIYLAIIYSNQPVTSKWLEAITGYSDKPISKGLMILDELEMIIKTRNGWRKRKNKQYKIIMPIEEKAKNEKYKILEEYGIREPKLSELAFNKKIEIEYIKAHIKKAIVENISAGLLIHRLISNDKMPEMKKNGHLKECECDECIRRRYMEGKYGDFGNY